MKIEQKKNTGKPLYATGAAFIAATMMLGGCSLATPTPTTTVQLMGDTTVSEPYYETGIVNGYRYEILTAQEYGPELDAGWYIRNTGNEKYILVCDGEKSTGGYYLNIDTILYDSANDTVVITVVASRDEGVVTDAITHPCCSVSFDKIPDKIQVVYDNGAEIAFGGNIIDTDVWAVDIVVDDDYTAVFRGYMYSTYIYEVEGGKYRYINVYSGSSKQNPDQTEFVKGSGIAETVTYLEYVCRRFGSFETVVIKGDENNEIPAEEYIKMLGG